MVEMMVYGLFISAYCLLVLYFLRGWLAELFHSNKPLYAVIALVLIIAQSALLESVLIVLFKLVRGNSKSK